MAEALIERPEVLRSLRLNHQLIIRLLPHPTSTSTSSGAIDSLLKINDRA
jgi:hypothetical protein